MRRLFSVLALAVMLCILTAPSLSAYVSCSAKYQAQKKCTADRDDCEQRAQGPWRCGYDCGTIVEDQLALCQEDWEWCMQSAPACEYYF